MQRKNEEEDPYELIRNLRRVIQSEREAIEEYHLICDSLFHEKNASIREANHLKLQVQTLTRQLQHYESTANSRLEQSNSRLEKSTQLAPREYKEYNSLRQHPSLRSLTLASPNKPDISSTLSFATPSTRLKKENSKTIPFVPGEIKFNKRKTLPLPRPNDSIIDTSQESIGDFLIEDVVVVAPDITELKRLREEQRDAQELNIQKYVFFNHNKFYQSNKEEYLRDIAQRAFPMGATATRTTVEDVEQFKSEMEQRSDGAMGEEFFIFTLKGDFDVPPRNERVFLGGCNPFKGLFAVCMKVKDFVPIREESRHLRNETVVWVVNKIYVVLTYYPFFNLHLAVLSKIHRILEPKWHLLHGEEVFARNLTRNLAEAQKNYDYDKMVSYLRKKIPGHGEVCQWDNEYLGTLPPYGPASTNSISMFTSPIFFSVFAYEEMLVLITALFMEKTIVFVSESESAATCCALFLVSCIAPFIYHQHLILNCSNEMIDDIVFGFPLTLVASLKKPKNITRILSSFVENNTSHFRGFKGKEQTAPLVLVDIDSNTILHDPELNKQFENIIVDPSKELREAYLAVNSAYSKSFSFPKKMPVEYQSARPRNDHEKTAEEKKKMLKDYQQKIESNTTRWPNYRPTHQTRHLHNLLLQYLGSFVVDEEFHEELLVRDRPGQLEFCREYLATKHSDKRKFVDVVLGSQIFASYLDRLEKGRG